MRNGAASTSWLRAARRAGGRARQETSRSHAHREMIVAGVGHSSRAMWLSGVGAGALFGN